MNRRRSPNRAPLFAITALLLSGCLTGKDSGDAGDGARGAKGRVYLAGGGPAVGARVRLFPVNHVPEPGALAKRAGPAYEARTDGAGEYSVDSLAKGEYNILSELDGELAFADSILIDAGSGLPADTLRGPGSLAGRIRLEPNHDPRTAILQVLGTHLFANVERDGSFLIGNLPQGSFNLRVMTTIGEYSLLHKVVQVRAGKRDSLPPLEPVFTGIPVVKGLAAAYDTLQGTMRLSWNPTDYAFLEEYLVYRVRAGSLTDAELLVGRTRDTSFSEAFFPSRDRDLDAAAKTYEYSVRIKNLSGQLGLRFGSLQAEAVPPARVQTFSSLEVSDGGTVGIQDSIRLDLEFENRGRRIRAVTWYAEDGKPLKTKADSSLTGRDQIRLAWDAPGEKEIRVVMTDEGGQHSFDTARVQVLLDAPVAIAGSDTVLEPGRSLRLTGKGTDRFGAILRKEWDIGGTGIFRPAADGDTLIQAGAAADTGLPCILRVTDNRGLVGLDTLRVWVLDGWRMLPPPPMSGDFAGGFDSSVLLVNRLGKTAEFDFREERWSARASGQTGVLAMVDIQGAPVILTYEHITRSERWDKATKSWTSTGSHVLRPQDDFQVTTAAERIFSLVDGKMVYGTMIPAQWGFLSKDITRGSHPGPWKHSPAALREIGGSVYVAQGVNSGGTPVDWTERIAISGWEYVSMPARLVNGPVHADFAYDGSWYLIGAGGTLEVFNPETNAWSLKAPIPGFSLAYSTGSDYDRPQVQIRDGKAHLFVRRAGRIKAWTYALAADSWQAEKDWPLESTGPFLSAQAAGRIILGSSEGFQEFKPR